MGDGADVDGGALDGDGGAKEKNVKSSNVFWKKKKMRN